MSIRTASLAILALLIPLAPASFALAQDTKGVNMRALGDRNPAPAKPGSAASGMKPCPEYGAGFYRLAGSDTCARISGGVASEVGTTVRR
jgi:Porin subfamily